MPSLARSLLPLAALVAFAGCSKSSSPEVAAADSPDGGQTCKPAPGGETPGGPPTHCVREVTGKVLATEDGRPLAGLTMTVCGRVCFGAQTEPTGAFRVVVNARLQDGQYTLFAHGRPRRASLFIPVPASPPERLELAPAIELPALSAEGTPLPPDDGPEATMRVGPLSFGVPAGTSWELSFEDATDEVDGRQLRFVKVPLERAPRFAEGAALVYAVAPFDAVPSKPLSLRIAETGGLAAGAAVDVVVMDGFDITETNTSGRPSVAARGHVTADGTGIETDPGQGLSVLTWIAVRAVR